MALIKYSRLIHQIILLLDIVLTGLAFIAAVHVRDFLLPIIPSAGAITIQNYYFHIALICLVWLIILSFQDGYSKQRFLSLNKEITQIAKMLLWGFLIVSALGFLSKETSLPRTLLVLFLFINFAFLVAEKAILHKYINHLRAKGFNHAKVLIVGTSDLARRFVESAGSYEPWGIDVVGFLAEDESKVGTRISKSKVIGTFKDLEFVLHSNYIDEVIFATDIKHFAEVEEMFKKCRLEGVQARVISSILKDFVSSMTVDIKYGYPILTYSPFKAKDWQLLLKRVIDIAISSILLIPFTLVILPVVSALIKLTSEGPIFYRWQVMGANKRRFIGYKFRTMYINADEIKKQLMEQNEMSGPVFKMERDPRITPVGRFLRKLSIDELPQLWSVLKGDMSLVGPRPPLQSEVEHFESWHRRKLSVKPGITCLWQINGRSQISDFNEWVKLDLEYIDNWSLWLDMKILFKTIPVVLLGIGAR
ncbi:MAG: sugar transferase [Deferribacteres bacterium]|nr:sugar transferase [candidate division KSB1 bacterium]MCB9508722.1 sugar transferase [Deferribacteres bacterium]